MARPDRCNGLKCPKPAPGLRRHSGRSSSTFQVHLEQKPARNGLFSGGLDNLTVVIQDSGGNGSRVPSAQRLCGFWYLRIVAGRCRLGQSHGGCKSIGSIGRRNSIKTIDPSRPSLVQSHGQPIEMACVTYRLVQMRCQRSCMRASTSAFMVIVRPHSRSVSPGHLLVASRPSLPPSPDTGDAKSR